jgi:putative transposase
MPTGAGARSKRAGTTIAASGVACSGKPRKAHAAPGGAPGPCSDGWRVQRRLARRERLFQRDINHLISRRLVQTAQATGRGIAREDLRGIRERTNAQPRPKGERARSNSWAFAQLRTFIAYKARAAGIPVVIVPAAYTSQTCHRCLHIGKRSGKHFHCGNPRCGWSGDADLNGACMIALVGDAVMVPGGPGLSCPLGPRATTSPGR